MSRSAEDTLNTDAGSMELIGDPGASDKPAEDKPADKPADKKDERDLATENATLKAQLAAEKDKSTYWKGAHDKVTTRPTTSRLPSDEGKEDPPDDDEEDIVEILAKGNKTKIKAAFAKLGFASKDEVERELSTRWAQVESAAQVQGRHQEIADPNSELHQETLKVMDSLKREGVDVPNLIGISADIAFTNLVKSGRIKLETPDPKETDEERIERILTQQGHNSSRRRNPSDGADEGLSDSQKLICKKFGLDEKAYAARANRGVRIAGVPKG